MDSPEQVLADTALRGRLLRHVRGDEPGGMLRSLKVKLLSSCNLRCEMCDYWRIERIELPFAVVRRALDDAAALGCRKVHLSGGEVTLYPDLEAVIAHGVAVGLRVNLTTNGVELDRRRARAWVEGGVHAVALSLDGARADTHDTIRGVPGAFDRAVKGARNLMRENARRGRRVRLRINTVVQRRNLAEQVELVRLAVELGACDVVPMPIDGESADRPSLAELREYNAAIAPRVAEVRHQFGLPTSPDRVYPFGEGDLRPAAAGDYARGYYDRHLCHAPWLHCFVSHRGDVFACCMTNERMPALGSIHRDSLRDLFAGQAYERFRAAMRGRRLDMCRHCDQFLPENRALNDGLGLPPTAAPRQVPLPLLSPMQVSP